MRHHAHPRLINPPFSDPGVYLDTGRRRGAMLFDIGETGGLSGDELARVTHLFISHTHMDHVMGFDRLVRQRLGKRVSLDVTGPEGIIAHIGSRLSAYTWNLVGGDGASPSIFVTEVRPEHHLRQRFDCRSRFLPDRAPLQTPPGPVVHDDGRWRVSTAILDHRTPCLGFRMTEAHRLNVDVDALERSGFAPGAWVGQLKRLAADGPITAGVRVTAALRSGGQRRLPAVDLARDLICKRTGKSYAYITDAAYSPKNVERIVRLAQGVDHLFIEAPFLAMDETHAAAKCHLTARQAGILAALAGAADFTIFHFSPRYRGREDQLEAEARCAYLETDAGEAHRRRSEPRDTSQ